MIETFRALFRGSSLAHGTWEKATGNMATPKSAATLEDYANHLSGKLGLGIIPVNEEGICYFGAIDIDIDTIDHKELYDRVRTRNLPLTVCRSKSGGAHCYAFFRDGHPAASVQSLLKGWAALLGFPAKTEIFPKQTKSTAANYGNWINLPYFNAENTVRYSVGGEGARDLEEFLRSVIYYTGVEKIDTAIGEDLIQIKDMPPCLTTLANNGFGSGSRNTTLFSYGVFYRKASPNGWQNKLRAFNQQYVSPSLPTRELEALIKSLTDRQYQYKCDEEPLCSHCDRKTCLTLPYGVGNKPWEDESNFDEIVTCNLRKILTDPPTYVLEINGKDLHMSSDEFRDFGKLRKRLFETRDLVLRPVKQGQWDQRLRELLAIKTDVEAPDDASEFGAVLSKVDDYLALCERSKGREDLLRGMPIEEEGSILFQVGPLQKYLLSQRVMIDNSELFSILHRRSIDHKVIKIKGKAVRTWSMKADLVNRQSEEYTQAEFGPSEGEL